MTNVSHDLLEYEDIGEDYVISPTYLFKTESCLVDFVVIQEELEQLHDYFLLCTKAASAKLTELKTNLADYKTGKIIANDEVLGDLTLDVIDGLEQVQIPQWEDTQSFLVTAMCLVLLSALLERALKKLCVSFATSGKGLPRERSGTNKATMYIEFLQGECGLDFLDSDSSIHIREKFRKVRNAFAHGDWDDVRDDVQGCSLRKAFEACSVLFSGLESAYKNREVERGTEL